MSRPGQTADIRVRNLQRRVPINAKGLEKFARKALPLCLKLRKTKATDLIEASGNICPDCFRSPDRVVTSTIS